MCRNTYLGCRKFSPSLFAFAIVKFGFTHLHVFIELYNPPFLQFLNWRAYRQLNWLIITVYTTAAKIQTFRNNICRASSIDWFNELASSSTAFEIGRCFDSTSAGRSIGLLPLNWAISYNVNPVICSDKHFILKRIKILGTNLISN